MLVVHHLNNSRSQRVLWLLEELGLDYDVKRYQRDAETLLAPASLRRLHPLGKSPIVTDGELVLAESGAVLEYLVEQYGAGRLIPPPGSAERLRYRYWLHYAEGSAMPPLLLMLVANRIAGPQMPFLLRPVARMISKGLRQKLIDPQIGLHLDFMEQELAERDWFAGDEFSAADVQMSFPLEAAAARGGLDARRPRLMAWLARIHARPAYQQALVTGGSYELVRR
jgi:glutathione S-transferase